MAARGRLCKWTPHSRNEGRSPLKGRLVALASHGPYNLKFVVAGSAHVPASKHHCGRGLVMLKGPLSIRAEGVLNPVRPSFIEPPKPKAKQAPQHQKRCRVYFGICSLARSAHDKPSDPTPTGTSVLAEALL